MSVLGEFDKTGPNGVLTLVLRPSTPPLACGIALAGALVVLEILIVLLLKSIAPGNTFGAVFLFGVLVISALSGFGLAVATSVASAAAYAYIHVAENSESLVPAVLVFLVLALLTNVLVGQSRLRAAESDQRRREADLLAGLARTLLRTPLSPDILADAGIQFSTVLELPPPHAVLGPVDAPVGDDRQRILLKEGNESLGSLLVPAELTSADRRRVRRVVPALEALFAAAQDREALHLRTVTLARRQAALRRVATRVALRGEPVDVYEAVTRELAESLDVEHVSLVHYRSEQYESEEYVVLAARDDASGPHCIVPGERFALGGHNISTIVHATGAATELDVNEATGPVAARLQARGLLRGVGVPIDIDGVAWGAVIIGTTGGDPDLDLREHLTDFADLVATAVYNSETRLQLTRSRARVVAAADQARRTIERDLHDGAQQRIVSLGMELRLARIAAAEGSDELRHTLDRGIETLAQIHNDLRELSRGIHPAILSRGGLAPALKTLARRSPVPVSLTATIPDRLPESIEVAAYYVVAEALTNTAKYAEAQSITISASVSGGQLHLTVSDDGCGGADMSAGSGLLGLHDRVAAVGGTLNVASADGEGTCLRVAVDLPAPTGRAGTTG
nr:GAF domain-containing sensor histidine kinase [Rhodococcus sp. (in: high G+C Gram-positive bacteria)]